MEQKLYRLFFECVNELNKIGIDILNQIWENRNIDCKEE